jgi:hypothetical protein
MMGMTIFVLIAMASKQHCADAIGLRSSMVIGEQASSLRSNEVQETDRPSSREDLTHSLPVNETANLRNSIRGAILGGHAVNSTELLPPLPPASQTLSPALPPTPLTEVSLIQRDMSAARGIGAVFAGELAGIALEVAIGQTGNIIGMLPGLGQTGSDISGALATLGFGGADATNYQVLNAIDDMSDDIKTQMSSLKSTIGQQFEMFHRATIGLLSDTVAKLQSAFAQLTSFVSNIFAKVSVQLKGLAAALKQGFRSIQSLMLRHHADEATQYCETAMMGVQGMFAQLADANGATRQVLKGIESMNIEDAAEVEKIQHVWQDVNQIYRDLAPGLASIDEKALQINGCLVGTAEMSSGVQKFVTYLQTVDDMSPAMKLQAAANYFTNLLKASDETVILLLASRVVIHKSMDKGILRVAEWMQDRENAFSHFWEVINGMGDSCPKGCEASGDVELCCTDDFRGSLSGTPKLKCPTALSRECKDVSEFGAQMRIVSRLIPIPDSMNPCSVYEHECQIHNVDMADGCWSHELSASTWHTSPPGNHAMTTRDCTTPPQARAPLMQAMPSCFFGRKVLITSHRNQNLGDFNGKLSLRDKTSNRERWTISDAGDGKVFIKSHRNQYLQDNNGKLQFFHRRSATAWRKWAIRDAGAGKVFIQSHRSQNLQDSKGALKLHVNDGSWMKWYIRDTSGSRIQCAEEQRYVVGTALDNTCPSLSHEITTWTECQSAAAKWGFDGEVVSATVQWAPKGCVKWDHHYLYVFFNLYDGDRRSDYSDSHTRPICKRACGHLSQNECDHDGYCRWEQGHCVEACECASTWSATDFHSECENEQGCSNCGSRRRNGNDYWHCNVGHGGCASATGTSYKHPGWISCNKDTTPVSAVCDPSYPDDIHCEH